MEVSDSQARAMERHADQPVNKVSLRGPEKFNRSARGGKHYHSSKKPLKQCWKYGRVFPHKETPCPTRDQKCHKCQKGGHFQAVCRNKKDIVKKEKVQNVTQHSDSVGSDSDVDDYCSGIKVVESGVNRVKGPYANVTVNKHKLKMLVDSGSSVNILDEQDYA